MAKIRICKEPDCNNAATTEEFCRLHYLKNRKRLKGEHLERSAKKLNKYIENVVRRNPDRYMEVIKKDLRSPKFESIAGAFEDEGPDPSFDGLTYDEEVEELIKQLKIEKGF